MTIFIVGKVLVGSFQEDFGEDLQTWALIITILTRQSEWATLIIVTLIFHTHEHKSLV